MTAKKAFVLSLMVGIALHFAGISSIAQSGEKFRGRLAPVPALGIPVASVAGVGSAAATLAGRKLTITGTFEKMASPATAAKLYLGPLIGVRGDPVFDLTVTKSGDGTSGTIAGSIDLTAQQADAFKKGLFYVQIHSTGAPNGHLMGWLLK